MKKDGTVRIGLVFGQEPQKPAIQVEMDLQFVLIDTALGVAALRLPYEAAELLAQTILKHVERAKLLDNSSNLDP